MTGIRSAGECLHAELEKTVAILLLTALLAGGCSSAVHRVDLEKGYRLQSGTKFVVAPVQENATTYSNVDSREILNDALTKALRDRDLFWTNDPTPKLTLTAQGIYFYKGGPFTLGDLPMPSSNIPASEPASLEVRITLTGSDNRVVGDVSAKRRVRSGFWPFTIGAWKSLFDDVAGDIVTDLEEQLAQVR